MSKTAKRGGKGDKRSNGVYLYHLGLTDQGMRGRVKPMARRSVKRLSFGFAYPRQCVLSGTSGNETAENREENGMSEDERVIGERETKETRLGCNEGHPDNQTVAKKEALARRVKPFVLAVKDWVLKVSDTIAPTHDARIHALRGVPQEERKKRSTATEIALELIKTNASATNSSTALKGDLRNLSEYTDVIHKELNKE